MNKDILLYDHRYSHPNQEINTDTLFILDSIQMSPIVPNTFTAKGASPESHVAFSFLFSFVYSGRGPEAFLDFYDLDALKITGQLFGRMSPGWG